ncbi:hypothetical protein BP00DRAFT_43950 [Aspergillus indologenus CBS 114.80]|uniref:Uncharacterized protein n=1 Tax=Aspergillus indologenus CBS 114.80 TaxID=1450541 RepID=A0A2V5HW50_9EURO|nr:hypothetical protein BP00DRAFT_43950 [Aspergillus indologenus CBS 114.80]
MKPHIGGLRVAVLRGISTLDILGFYIRRSIYGRALDNFRVFLTYVQFCLQPTRDAWV